MQHLARSNWLERRVGAAGDGWAAIRNGLIQLLPQVGKVQTIGLDDAALASLGQEHRFDDLAAHFPTRGDSAALGRTARFGSQLAAVACAAAGVEALWTLLVDGALFNVAVALFDTIVDDQPHRLAAATASLAPGHMDRHLLGGLPLPRSKDDGVELVVRLFRTLFESVRQRATATHRVLLAAALTDMYHTEVSDPTRAMHAKVLPTVFFGEFVAEDRRRARTLMQRLATFVADIDDWQDLPSDFIAQRPNSFLGQDPRSARYRGMRLWQVVGGELAQLQTGVRLASALSKTLKAAKDAGSDAEAATVEFVRCLLGARP